VTNQTDSETRPSYSIADLAADAADVQRVLHLDGLTVKLPDRHIVVVPNGVIPDRALALVAGLDSYGD
jgi:chaperone required for assembly of F1-ATPase